MKACPLIAALCVAGLSSSCAPSGTSAPPAAQPAASAPTASLLYPGEEAYLANIRQLTFGGQNAEAYWSANGKKLIFQSDWDSRPCDQIFTMGSDGSRRRMVSNGEGKTTCAFFFPGGDRILYSSTLRRGAACPPAPDRSRGYVWALYDYDIYSARADGSGIEPLFSSTSYDAEATVSRDGARIVFTSARDGDLEIYTMDAQGGGVARLTNTPGYDGGPFFSFDGAKIVYRADHPQAPEDLARYRNNLAAGVYTPRSLEIRVMRSDGSGDRAVTANGAANFAPAFFPDGQRIIFSSNLANPKGRDFDLYAVSEDGTGLVRLTFNPTFDGFPMFNGDGSRLVFASNRNGSRPGETNIFVADWVAGRGR
jgi:Tol biopolymer transport system component